MDSGNISRLIFDNYLAIILVAVFLGWHFGKKSHEVKRKRKIEISNPEIFRLRMVQLGIIFGLMIALAITYFYFRNTDNQSLNEKVMMENSDEKPLLDKNVYGLPEKPSVGGLNLIFFADDYSSWDEFEADSVAVMQGLKKFSPWDKFQYFNIYRIKPGDADRDICTVKSENERKPTLRCSEKINGYLHNIAVERFRLIVLSRRDFQSWANVSRIENSGIFFSVPKKIEEQDVYGNGLLMAHLMGHAFGLKDEEKYVVAKAEGAPHTPDGPNCAPDEETARKWWGDLAEKYPDKVGFFHTCCGDDNYIKPTISSIMNLGSDMENFNPTYGLVSENYLEKLLSYCYSSQRHSYADDPSFFEIYPEVKTCLE